MRIVRAIGTIVDGCPKEGELGNIWKVLWRVWRIWRARAIRIAHACQYSILMV